MGTVRRGRISCAVAASVALSLSFLAAPAIARETTPTATNSLPGYLQGVSAVGSDDVWAVGVDAAQSDHWTTLAEHWNGSSWSRVHTPSPGSLENELNGVVAISADNVWAVGNSTNQIGGTDQTTLIEHWDGASWTQVASPTPRGTEVHLKSVSAVAPDDIWAVGYYSPPKASTHTLTLHWDGARWTRVPSPNLSDVTGLTSVATVTANDVWAAGYFYAGHHRTPPLLLHWDGSSWSSVKGAPTGQRYPVGLLSISADSSADIWTSGWARRGQGYTAHWGGTRWASVPLPGTPALFGISARTPSDVWAVGEDYPNRSVATEHWDGSTWTLDESLTPKRAALMAVTALAADDVWAVGFSKVADQQTRILIEHEDGTGWHQS